MSNRVDRESSFVRVARWAAIGFACLIFCASVSTPAIAQVEGLGPSFGDLGLQDDSQLLLEADQLVYDFDNMEVTAIGDVQIFYDGYTVTAERVTYKQLGGRLIASGNVVLVEPGGTIIRADEVDITDDLREGFIASLNVETIDRVRFAAQSAERRDGNVTIFNQGVYTACEQCSKNKDSPPLWQIKATKIVYDKSKKRVFYEDAKLEFFGVPIAYLPFFYHPDPSSKRQTGFLIPRTNYTEAIGWGLTVPFFWNLAPNYDITFTPTIYTIQGVLGQAEWRHRLMNGSYSIRLSGIFQQDREKFAGLSGDRNFRGSVDSKALFEINSEWNWGWDLFVTTDRTFGRDYRLTGFDDFDVPSTIFLNGMSERNYFDARGYYFRVQREDPTDDPTVDFQAEQARIHPIIDHDFIFDAPIFGGELAWTSNLTSLSRDASDQIVPGVYDGVAGSFTRATGDLSWKRTLIGPAGQVFTPFAYLNADLNWSTPNDPAAGLESGFVARGMPAIGLEYRWPFLATTNFGTQTFGPIAQIIVRPNEKDIRDLPNDDAQSLIFDETTLFRWDKFSGFDRTEGGTRANLGFTYRADLNNGDSFNALVGQSYQLAGQNSYAVFDVAATGTGSGLESDVSDIVAAVGYQAAQGSYVSASGRFDHETFALNRSLLTAAAVYGGSSARLDYIFLKAQPALGITENRQEVSGSASLALDENWTIGAGLVYDLENNGQVSNKFGVSYSACDCLTVTATYEQTRDRYSDLVTDKEFLLRINLRTLGGGDVGYSVDNDGGFGVNDTLNY